MTESWFRGSETEMVLRLCSRAPRTRRNSCGIASESIRGQRLWELGTGNGEQGTANWKHRTGDVRLNALPDHGAYINGGSVPRFQFPVPSSQFPVPSSQFPVPSS